jgi:pimeloyl-ACP methyl ester carboxylesterase
LQSYLSFPERAGTWAVVYVHGFGSTGSGDKAQALEAACAGPGWTFASFEFRGHGTSSGSLLELRGSALLDDLMVLRAHWAERGIARLCLFGSSMGGWAASWFALQNPELVPACVLLAPAFDFPTSRWAALTEPERRQWQQTGRLRVRNEYLDVEIGYGLVEEADRFPVQSLTAQWRTPALIFHGMEDDVVPYANSLKLTESTPFPSIELRLFKDGDHRLLAHKEEMAEAACAFFGRRVSGEYQPTS